jgi:hypothetical protein
LYSPAHICPFHDSAAANGIKQIEDDRTKSEIARCARRCRAI